MNPLFVKAASIFGAGVLTSLTPCVYPMIPITLGYLGGAAAQQKKKASVWAFFLGQVLAFTSLGVLAVWLGEILGFSSQIKWVQYATAAFLYLFAYYSWKGQLPQFLTKSSQFSAQRKVAPSTFLGAFSIGALSAIVASPCASPILGGVLATVAQSNSLWIGSMLMFIYALGVCGLFLVLGLGAVSIAKLPRSGQWLGYIHKLSTLLLFGAGTYYLVMATEVL